MLTQEEILYKLIQGDKGKAWVTLNAQWDIDDAFAGEILMHFHVLKCQFSRLVVSSERKSLLNDRFGYYYSFQEIVRRVIGSMLRAILTQKMSPN
jgi:hypothetical protein